MRSIREIDWNTLRNKIFHSSPEAWEDQTFYFLLVDRFSDGNEADYRDNMGEGIVSGTTPPGRREEVEGTAFKGTEIARSWRRAGGTWCGGNLRGLTTKLGYLKRLGITAIWISPLLKQSAYSPDSYHGYGTQDFLEVDPHFGTKDDLRALVTTAHGMGMYVVLDIILNHTADVFAYAEDGDLCWRPEPYPVAGFRDAQGEPALPFGPIDAERFPAAYPDGAVWPSELQQLECFTRKGRIEDWDNYPEYEEGDFFAYKDLSLGTGDEGGFQPSPALRTLVEVYKYWIALADLDGFRLDTVKHMPNAAVQYFAREIHTFAESIGKRNFYLIGEIVGDRADVCSTLLDTSLNAALGIAEVPRKIRSVIQGTRDPAEYFDIFVNSRRVGECHPDPVWWRDRVVTFFDDHDQVGKNIKGRLASDFGDDRQRGEASLLRAVAFQTLTLGIPCLYYGTEQGFDGHVPDANDSLRATEDVAIGPSPDDQLIRECLFGGPFGAFRSVGHHFFDETGWLYQQIAHLLKMRHAHPALRRGRQYLREISVDGERFWTPVPGEEPYQGVIAWSRLLDVDEFVCAINTDSERALRVLVTTDTTRHARFGGPLVCLYSTESAQIGHEACPVETANRNSVEITVPPGGIVVYR